MKVKCSGGCGREFDIRVQRIIGKYTASERCEMIHVVKNPEIKCRDCIENDNKRNTDIS